MIRPINAGAQCPVCTATYAIWPLANKMVCHCAEYPWFPVPATGGTFADGVEAAAKVADAHAESQPGTWLDLAGKTIAAAIRALQPGAGREDGA